MKNAIYGILDDHVLWAWRCSLNSHLLHHVNSIYFLDLDCSTVKYWSCIRVKDSAVAQESAVPNITNACIRMWLLSSCAFCFALLNFPSPSFFTRPRVSCQHLMIASICFCNVGCLYFYHSSASDSLIFSFVLSMQAGLRLKQKQECELQQLTWYTSLIVMIQSVINRLIY